MEQMRWDLGEPELLNTVAANDNIISSLREQLSAETERENLQRMQPDYAAEKEEVPHDVLSSIPSGIIKIYLMVFVCMRTSFPICTYYSEINITCNASI